MLYEKVCASLKKGGVFTSGDFVAFENEAGNRKATREYASMLGKKLGWQQAEKWVTHATTQDKPSTIRQHKAWLLQAGFSKVEVLWKRKRVAVIRAAK